MIFLRTLILVAVAVLLFYWLRRARSVKQTKPVDDAQPAEGLLRCAFCAVNFPATDAVTPGGELFCTEAHQEASKYTSLAVLIGRRYYRRPTPFGDHCVSFRAIDLPLV